MKFERMIQVGVGLGLCGVAFGQSFALRAGAGAVASGNTFLVNPVSTFDIEVWAVLPTAIPSSTQLHVAVAFGDAQGTGTSAVPVNTMLSYQAWFWSNYSSQNYTLSAPTPTTRSAATALTGNNYVTTNPSLLPIVAYGARVAQTPVNVPAGQTLLATLRFNVLAGSSLTSQTIFVAHNGGPSGGTGTSGINPGFGSPHYRVQVVPEPATLSALACGILVLARRKRRSGM